MVVWSMQPDDPEQLNNKYWLTNNSNISTYYLWHLFATLNFQEEQEEHPTIYATQCDHLTDEWNGKPNQNNQ